MKFVRPILMLILLILAFAPSAHAQTLRIDRLERLAGDLEGRVQRLHEARTSCFKMDPWANGDDPASADFDGCAAAHGTYLLADEGLRIKRLVPTIDGKPRYSLVFGDLYGIHATMAFFGIDYTTTCRFFGYSRDSQPSPREVAARIRSVIAEERTLLAALGVGGGAVLIAAR